MADEVLNLQIQINAETGQLEVVSKGLSDIGSQAEKTGGSFTGLSKGARELLKTLGLIASVGAIVKFFADSVKQVEAFNEGIRKVEFNLKALGKEADLTREELIKWGQTVQANTRFADDEAIEVLNKFIRVTGDVKQSQSASKLAMDLSVASGKDLSATTEILTGLMLGQQRSVIQANREFGAFTGGVKDTQSILDNLQKNLGGASEKEDSLTKQTHLLKNAWDDFGKMVGGFFIPAIQSLIKWLTIAIGNIENFGVVFAGIMARVVIQAEYTWKQITASAKFNFEEVGRLASEKQQRLFEIGKEEQERFDELEKNKTKSSLGQVGLRSRIDEEALREKLKKQKEEDDKARAFMEKHMKDSMELRRKEGKEREKIEKENLEKIHKLTDEAVEKWKKERRKNDEEIKAESKKVAEFTSGEFAKAFTDTILHGENFAEAMTKVFERIIEMIIQTIIQTLILRAIMGVFTGGASEVATPVASTTGGGFAGVTPVMKALGFTGGGGAGGGGTFGAPAFAGGVGEGQTPNVTINVNLSTDKLSIDNHKAIINALASEIGKETAEGIKLAVKMSNVAMRNSSKAV